MSTDQKIQKQKEYIVPPGLISKFYSLAAHYNAADGEPVMIVGDTGVGKTMFLLLYEILYKMDKGYTSPIIKANCAHFGGRNSDPNIARTELFGLKAASISPSRSIGKTIKRADTGTVKMEDDAAAHSEKSAEMTKFFKTDKGDVVGLVERANGGLLILEEIGELPLEVQAMLLTFIETGEYRRVGDTDPISRKSSVMIIGATNRESLLRDDFRYRFFPFYIPPINERRVDVLYYMASRFPWLIKSLSPWEILSILAYHWPGGVREIERVGRLLWRRREVVKHESMKIFTPSETDVKFDEPERLLLIEKRDTALDASKILDLYKGIKKGGINVNALERLLNQFNVGLNPDSKKRPFEDYKGFKILHHVERRFIKYPILVSELYEPFQDALKGYYLFCSTFLQDPNRNENNSDVTTPTSIEFFYDLKNLPEKFLKPCQQTMNEVFEFLSGIKLPKGTDIPAAYAEREAFFTDMINKYPDNNFLSSLSKIIPFKTLRESSNNVDIFSMKNEEFVEYYITGLRNRWGSIPKAAKILGISEQTLYSKRRSNKNKLSQ